MRLRKGGQQREKKRWEDILVENQDEEDVVLHAMSPLKKNLCQDEIIGVRKRSNTLVILSNKKLIFRPSKVRTKKS